MGPYIVDFVCFEQKIIIELDGGQHQEQIEKDQKRDQFFQNQGYKVLRFWDNEVFQNINGVLEVIRMSCKNKSHVSSRSFCSFSLDGRRVG